MPNGAPGDHPITDILVHGLPVYSPAVDQLIREVVELGGRNRIDLRLFREYSPYGDPDVQRLEIELRDLLEELRRDAEERGWEVR
jgi:hypothetical protein